MKIIAIYGRVSTSLQEKEETIKNQLQSIREFADKKYADNGGYQIIQEYLDEGWSGDSLLRPQLDNLRQDARKKIWDTVIIYDPDRLARRYSYQELVTDELKEAGVEVLFVTIKPPENEEDKILYGVRGLFAQYERNKIAERFRQGKLRKLREGHILTTESLYGYRYIPKKEGPNKEIIHGYYEIDPIESAVVRKIFNWVANDQLTLRKIVKKLQEEGIRPRHSPRGVWSTSTLTTMLRHEGYVGRAHWGSSYATIPENPKNKDKYRKVKKSSRKSKPKENWYIVKIPAIIDEDLFQRARNQLELNLKTHQRNKVNDYLLSGLIRCTCGRTRAGEGPKHGAHLYYRCSDRVSSFPLKRTCFKRGLNARIADQLVWNKLNELMSNSTLIAKELERWNKQGQGQVKNEAIDIKAAKREILKLKKEEDRYNRAYGAGVFTIAQLKGYLTPLRERLSKLEASIVEVPQEIATSKADRLEELINLFNIALETPIVLNQDLDFGEKRAIITRTIDRVVGDQEGLKISGHIPLQTHVEQSSNNNKGILSLISTSNVELCSEDRYCRPAKRREIDAF